MLQLLDNVDNAIPNNTRVKITFTVNDDDSLEMNVIATLQNGVYVPSILKDRTLYKKTYFSFWYILLFIYIYSYING